jgi:hypothetical protein
MKTQERMLQIKSCEQMCDAGRAATAHFHKVCLSDPSQMPKETTFRLADILECHQDLEKTYLIRLFALFEATVRDFWRQVCGKKSHPLITSLLDRIASRWHMHYDVLSNTHVVRKYRNSLVHGWQAQPMTLSEARAYVCTFLSYLPREW